MSSVNLWFIAYFIWADAVFGKDGEITVLSSPLIEKLDSLCFDFWFDVRVGSYMNLKSFFPIIFLSD